MQTTQFLLNNRCGGENEAPGSTLFPLRFFFFHIFILSYLLKHCKCPPLKITSNSVTGKMKFRLSDT